MLMPTAFLRTEEPFTSGDKSGPAVLEDPSAAIRIDFYKA